MFHFGLNLGQTAEDSDMFTNIWLSSKGLTNMHIWEGVSVGEEQWRRVTDKVITIEHA